MKIYVKLSAQNNSLVAKFIQKSYFSFNKSILIIESFLARDIFDLSLVLLTLALFIHSKAGSLFEVRLFHEVFVDFIPDMY